MNREVDMFGVRITEVCEGMIKEVYQESDRLADAIICALEPFGSPIEELALAVTYSEDLRWNEEPQSNLEKAKKEFRSAAKLLVEELAVHRKQFFS